MEQQCIFDIDETIHDELWKDMPTFDQADMTPYQSIKMHFASIDDRIAFEKLIGQSFTDKTKYAWYPKPSTRHIENIDFNDCQKKHKYPIYIISKGRADRPLTAKALEALNIDYRIVVEPQEYHEYLKTIDERKILILPFSDLGQGSIPVRNWVFERSIEEGHEKHWILDDNIDGFARLKFNHKVAITSGNPFEHVERFVDRYQNIAFAGLNYRFFAAQRCTIPPFYLNTRIYSCILVNNAVALRWRGRYNEDTDICLRALKDGWCTFLSNAVLANKMATMTMKGGNTDTVYNTGDNRLEFAESLRDQHPDCVKVTEKWGRYHHHVDYSAFKKNKLVEVI